MKRIVDLLDRTERRILGLLCVLVVAALLFHSLFALGEKRANSRLKETLLAGEKNLEEMLAINREKNREWERWEEARRDIEQLRRERFYREEGDINQLRMDLQKIFSEAGVRVSQISFGYNVVEEERIKKVTISFGISGSYLSLKRFLLAVENHPEFLVIERIDFLEIDARGGRLGLKLEMAGYYAI